MGLRVADLEVEMTARGDLVQQMTEAERRLAQIRQEATQTDRTLQGMQGAQGLTRDLQRSQQEMQQLGQSAQRTDREMGQMQVNESLRRDLQRLQQELEQLRQGARQAGNEMDNMGDSMGSSAGGNSGGGFLAGFTDKIKGLGGKGGPIAMALIGVAAVGLAAGGVLAKAIGDGMQSEVDRDKIQASMGISDEEMGKIARASADAYTNVFGDSVAGNMDAARKAFESGLLSSGEGQTQQEIQKVIEGLNTVAEITGEEIPAASRAAGQLMKTGMAANAEEAFDIIIKGQQKGLNASEDWLDTITEYSTKWRDLGLSAEDAMALQSQMVQKGARDTDVASDALKEFSIRARDGSESSAEAFEALGLSAEEFTDKFNQGGTVARDALQTVLTKMRELEDPTKKNAVAVGLFGTQAEDLGLALNNLDLERARQEFGTTAGTLASATKTMGDNAATSLEGAKRSIEVSMNGVKSSLAEAFGPTLEKVANWVNTHKPEITAFFVAIADACLATGQAIASFVSGTLRTLAFFAQASGQFFGSFLDQLGTTSSLLGSIIKHIPGMEDTGNAMERVGNAMKNYDSTMAGLSTTLTNMADTVDRGNEALGRTRASLLETGAETVATQEVFRALGDQVISVPDDKTITVTDNSPEAQARFAELGIRIEQIPGTKEFKLVANTADGQMRIDSFIKENTGKQIPVAVAPYLDPATMARVEAGIRDPSVRAGAAPFSPESGYVHYADGTADHSREPGITNKAIIWGEAGPEAYIPLDESKRARSTALLTDVARRFGLQVSRMANGGIVNPGSLTENAKGIEGAVYTWGGWDGSWNTDCSGAQARMANMIAYGDPNQGGRFATGNQAEALAARGFKAGRAPDGTPAYEIGWYNGGPGGGHTAGTAFDGKGGSVNIEMGGARGNGQYGGNAAGSRNPMFTDSAWIALATGANNGGGTSTGLAPAGTGLTSGGSTSPSVNVTTPSVMDVNVLNWPAALTENGSGAKARFGVALYGDGGTVPGAGFGDTEPALLTPGEEVIRRGPAQQFRSLLKAINAGRFANGGTVGGFGGGYDPNPDPSHKLGLYELLALASGVGLTAASAFSSTGQYQGFNTSNTSIPTLEDALNALAEKLQAQPAVVIEHAEVKADNPEELISSLAGINPALTQIVQKGLF